MRTHEDLVRDQFDPQSEAYLASAVHARGPDLARARALVAQALPARGVALDVGCGAGHLSFALAPHLARVVAFDAAPAMLATVAAAAASRGLPQVETRLGDAARLPFDDASFCLVCTRYSAHHWTDPQGALREMRRVLKPTGYLLAIDVAGDDSPLVDTHLQALELLRDRSHVRNHSVAQWRTLLATAGFAPGAHEQWPVRLEFAPWIARMRTPPDAVAMIRALQRGAPREVQERLEFAADGSFTVRTALFWSRPLEAARLS